MASIRKGTGRHAFLAEMEERLESTCGEWTDRLAFDDSPNKALYGFMDVLLQAGQKHFAKPRPLSDGDDEIRAERMELLTKRRSLRQELAESSTLGKSAWTQARLHIATQQAEIGRAHV